MKKEYHKQTQKKQFTPQEKKKIQNEVYTWIIFAMIVFWTVSSILGIIGFARSFKTDVATAETVATSVMEEPKQDSVSKIAVQGNRTKKIAKVNTNLPPATDDSLPTMPSMYGFDISINHFDLIESNSYTTRYSFPLRYDNGIGERIYEYDDYVPVYMSLSPTATIYTRYDYRQGFANTDLSVFDVRAEWVLGDTFVNEEWYEHFFGGFAISLGGATNYSFPTTNFRCVMTVSIPNKDYGTYVDTQVEFTGQSTGNNRYLEFNAPTWLEFYQMYGYESYCLIKDMIITFRIPTPWFQDYISITLNHLSTPRSYREFKELQDIASSTFGRYNFAAGQDKGENIGYEQGYNKGYQQGVEDTPVKYSFLGLLTAVVDGPFQVFYDMFNFELLGYNMTSFFLALLSACVVLAVLKVILGR